VTCFDEEIIVCSYPAGSNGTRATNSNINWIWTNIIEAEQNRTYIEYRQTHPSI